MRVAKLALLLLLGLASFAGATEYRYALRGELCYQNQGETWWDWNDNLFVAGSVDYRVITLEDPFMSIYTTPRVVYNHNEGFDLQLEIRAEVLTFASSRTLAVKKGAVFPLDFLNDCNVYTRINFYQH